MTAAASSASSAIEQSAGSDHGCERWERQESNQSYWSPGRKGRTARAPSPTPSLTSPRQQSSKQSTFDTASPQPATPEALQEHTASQQRNGGDQCPGNDEGVEKLIGSSRRHIPGLQADCNWKQLLIREHDEGQKVVVPDGHKLEEQDRHQGRNHQVEPDGKGAELAGPIN